TLACCGGFAVAGGLLAAGRLGRRTGAAFTSGAAAWALTWTASWNAGAGPVVSVFAQSVFFVAIGVGVLLYPGGRLDGAAARLWTGATAAVMIGGQAVLCALSRPAWNGFDPAAAWPSAAPDREAFDCAYRAVTTLEAGLAGALVIILLLRLPGTGRLDRRYTVPIAAAVTVGVAGALAVQGSLIGRHVTLDDVMEVYLFQGVSATVLPLAFLAATLRARLAELSAAERMQRLTDPVSVEKVRDALRRVLRDATLDLWLWAGDGYVDVTGRGAAAGAGPVPGRWRHEVRTSAGEPLAAVDADDRLRGHEPLVEAALVARSRCWARWRTCSKGWRRRPARRPASTRAPAAGN
ncbi:hypothetical protein, partial [Actinomadura montaniterrae]|uniref:hypothetical protein n=1 Tax=Actinomadura montaniterrae TaxID=1803903 RepID=UPI00178C55D2